jgi:Ca-activated chloride channel family protein
MLEHAILFNLPQASILILLLIPILLAQFALTRYRQKQQQRYTSSALLSHLLIPRSPGFRYAKNVGWALVWVLICLALMEPFGNIRYSPLSAHAPSQVANAQPYLAPHEVIFLVDTSASMRVPDGPDGQTRLEAAKGIVEDVLLQLRGQMVSLYAFTSELTTIVPSTLDYLFMRLSVRDLHIDEGDVGGTRFAPVLAALKQQAFAESSLKRYTIIMLSDGGDNQLDALQGITREQERQAILNAIPDPQQLHMRLFTIGVGSFKPQEIPHVTFQGKPILSKLEPEILQQLAAHERGEYYQANDWISWDLAQALLAQIEKDTFLEPQGAHAERKVAAINKEDVIVDLYYQVPLGLALLFYLLNLLLPDARVNKRNSNLGH